MIGNDIVDYSVDENKYLNQRFVTRCLSKIESDYLEQSNNKNAFFWSLWACKEAAYKAYQKSQLDCIFSPPEFELTETTLKALVIHDMQSVFDGEIRFKDHQLAIQLTWPDAMVVHCIADKKSESINECVVAIEQNVVATDNFKQSALTRVMADRLLKEKGIDAKILRPELDMGHYKKPGPPVLVDKTTGKQRPENISLSHDKAWLAFVLCLY